MQARTFTYALLLTFVLIAFLGVWAPLAMHIPAWSDESSHMSVGKGLLMTGEPRVFDFDQGKLTEYRYTRALAISYLTKWFYQIGGESILVARLMPLLFTLLTFVVYVWYRRARHKISLEHILIAGVLFFLQSMVLEKSLYVRYYAPLAFLFMISLIMLWEGMQSYAQRKFLRAMGMWVFGAGLLILPTLDTWHIQHIPMFFLAFVLLFFGHNDARRIASLSSIARHPWRVVSFLLGMIIVAPFLTILFNFLLVNVRFGLRRMDVSFSTYWDNAAGLVRYLLAVNVSVLGLRALLRGKWGFDVWLFLTGLLSGFAFGLFNPHGFNFYSRFFYVPVVLIVLGFSGIIASSISRPRLRYTLLGLYVVLNVLLSFTTFYYDRSTIKKAVTWLNANQEQTDVLLTFYSELGLNGGDLLMYKAHPIIEVNQDSAPIDALINLLEEHKQGTVFLLYSHHYQLRDTLYRWTTGTDRDPPNNLFRYLISAHAGGEEVLPAMRGSGLKRYRADELRTVLVDLKHRGFPAPPYRYLSWHYQLLSRVLTSLDIEKPVKAFFGR